MRVRDSLFAIRIGEKAKSIGMKIKDITRHKKFPGECVFAGIYREAKEEFLIPRGEHEIQGGDVIILVAKKESIPTVANLLTQERFSLW